MTKTSFWTNIALILLSFGVIGALNKYLINGEHAWGISAEVPWGALIAAYVFFAVSATGTGLVASLGHVFRIKKFEYLTLRALLASIVLLLSAFAVLAVELSNPFKMFWLLFTPNLNSPIFWMGVFYGIYLILLFGEFFCTLKNKNTAASAIAHVSLLVKLAAVYNLGRVFGFSFTREFWHGYYYPLYMIISAIVSGAAILIIITFLKDRKTASAGDTSPAAQILAKILAGAIITLAAIQAVKIGISLTSPEIAVAGAAKAILRGPVAPSFWIMETALGIAVPLAILFSSGFRSGVKNFGAALLAMVGLLFSRMNFVYSGQTYPLEIVPENCFALETFNSYSATWSEWFLILGALGFILLAFRYAENKLELDSRHS